MRMGWTFIVGYQVDTFKHWPEYNLSYLEKYFSTIEITFIA